LTDTDISDIKVNDGLHTGSCHAGPFGNATITATHNGSSKQVTIQLVSLLVAPLRGSTQTANARHTEGTSTVFARNVEEIFSSEPVLAACAAASYRWWI
jgi:hypothetical protein